MLKPELTEVWTALKTAVSAGPGSRWKGVGWRLDGFGPLVSWDYDGENIRLVVSNMNFIFHNIWDNPSH